MWLSDAALKKWLTVVNSTIGSTAKYKFCNCILNNKQSDLKQHETTKKHRRMCDTVLYEQQQKISFAMDVELNGKRIHISKKKIVPAKRIKTTKDCLNKCFYNCQKFISENERQNIFDRFYTLSEHGKRLFILATTKKYNVERHRKNKTNESSRRNQTFYYYFEVGSQQFKCARLFT